MEKENNIVEWTPSDMLEIVLNEPDDFLKIINTLQDENVFIISHKTDIISDKFANQIRVSKHKNFTRIDQ